MRVLKKVWGLLPLKSALSTIDRSHVKAKYGQQTVLRVVLVSLLTTLPAGRANAVSVDSHPNLARVVDELVAQNLYTKQELVDVMGQAVIQDKILNAMKNPAESKFTWGKYRKIFMQADRIESGAQFWRENAKDLQRAELEYGVPAEIIVAIIGVESKFGRYKGAHKVIDALVSLVVDFPRRSAFFADELKHFLTLVKENKFVIDEVMGSYAGAMGYPQFIASSYRHYAVDFSGDGVVDLINQPADAIGSIANYFVENGWQRGEAVTSESYSSLPKAVSELANRQRKAKYTAMHLRDLGAPIDATVGDSVKLNVLWLNAAEEVNDPQRSGLYTVEAGDTICQIAESFKLTCRELMALNNIDSSGHIYRGQHLKLPVNASNKSQSGGSADSKWSVNEKALGQPEVQAIDQYYFTHENFYVITRYNQSVLYAMAVFDLSNAIRSEYQKTNLDPEA